LGAQDVEAVDLLDALLAQRPDRLDPQPGGDRLAHRGAEPLRLVAEQPGRDPGPAGDRRARYHRLRQGSKPRLVDAADHRARLVIQRDLVTEDGRAECVAEEGEPGRYLRSEFSVATPCAVAYLWMEAFA
jgi:hypothetical protein